MEFFDLSSQFLFLVYITDCLFWPQLPPKRDETALQEEEELQLAIALSQSEAEEKERMVCVGRIRGGSMARMLMNLFAAWNSCGAGFHVGFYKLGSIACD